MKTFKPNNSPPVKEPASLKQKQLNTFFQLPTAGPVTCGHLAAWLSISTRQIYRMVEQGLLPAPRSISPTLRRFDAAEVWAFYKSELSTTGNSSCRKHKYCNTSESQKDETR